MVYVFHALRSRFLFHVLDSSRLARSEKCFSFPFKFRTTGEACWFSIIISGQIDGQEITAAPVLLPKPRPPPMRRMSPAMGRRAPMRWGGGGGGGGGGRNSPPRYRRRSPPINRRRSIRPPRRRQRTRSRSPPDNSRHRHRRYTRSSSSSSR